MQEIIAVVVSSTEVIGDFPKRIKIFLSIAVVIFILGYFALVIIEDMSFIDAFYFLIVTITTVGFGDITPQSDISKIIVSILIIISISSIALLSEQIVNRIVAINTQAYLELPTEPLEYQDHIIICGFTNIAENVAFLFQARFFRVIILDPHAVAVQRARKLGLEAYLTSPYQRKNLEMVQIDKAMGLYLFMDDENKNVLTSLQARSLSPDLLIYASTEHELSIELGNLIGINRTYHYERIVASNINFSIQKLKAFSLPNQLLSKNARFFIVIVSKDYDYKATFKRSIPIGFLDETLTVFTPIEDTKESIETKLEQNWSLLIAVSRDDIDNEFKDQINNAPTVIDSSSQVEKIIMGGYNPTARHVIMEMDQEIIDNFEFQILTFSRNEAKKAEAEGFDVIYAKREEVYEAIKHACDNSTLMVNLFDRLTDSLLVNTVVRQTENDIFIVQLAHNQIETEVLIKSGVNRILIPDILMSRGLFLILLSTKKFLNSIVYGNIHLFEHYIDADSPLKGKTIKQLHQLGYYALLYRSKSGKILEHVEDLQLETGDNILLYQEHEIVRRTDQLVDDTHN